MGGRCSDKFITENSGFLNNILPGDVILTDRGFDIRESVGLMCAEVKMPAFMKGRKQLTMMDVIDSRKIANVRIHVERVIGSIRQKYNILNSCLPIDFLRKVDEDHHAFVDKIVWVCCSLNNMCDTVVPFD